MPLKDKGLAALFLPGTIALPSPFPSVGDVEIKKDGEGAELRDGERGVLLTVRRRFEPSTEVCWTMLVERVSAILLTNGAELESDGAEWLFGPDVAKLQSVKGTNPAKGIVYVPENAPVLMRVEFGTTASESMDFPVPGLGGCDPCEDRSFSYQRVMAGQDEG
ncbi:MAG: hypothetical protein ACYSWU_09405 [Planctomycetota bacterium]|jgi:hypothetical protein